MTLAKIFEVVVNEITVNEMSIVEMKGLDIRCHFDKMTVAKTVIYKMIND